jgi:DNA-binding transcriptional regulator/RsmH inhibitor MraZ
MEIFEEKFGDEVFVTSLDDKNVRIYPLSTWYKLGDNIRKTKKDDPPLRKLLIKANHNGQIARVDRLGRVQIPGFLRKKIKLEGEIKIEEREDHLELTRV